MWGPWIRLRRRLRPLPTVGWVFQLRWNYGPQAHPLRYLFIKTVPKMTGMERDLIVPVEGAETAFETAKRLVADTLPPGAEIVAMRAADRRDIPKDCDGPLLGPRRHFGLPMPLASPNVP